MGKIVRALSMTSSNEVDKLAKDLENERLRDFAEAGADWFFELDSELRFTFASERLFEITGLSPEQIIGKTRWDARQLRRLPEEEGQWQDHIANMKACRDWKDYRYTLIRDDGERKIISNSAKAIFDDKGHFVGYRGIGRDVSAVVSSETHLNSVLATVSDAIITIDERGSITSFSQAAVRLFGLSVIRYLWTDCSLV